MAIPEWARKFKRKGTEIKEIGNNYYLYEVTSKYDPKIKRSRKKSGKYLGTITPEGVIKPKVERIGDSFRNISVKEFKATALIIELNEEIEIALKQLFADKWREILVFSIFRLLYNSPIKNLQTHYHGSFISETHQKTRLSPKYVGKMLSELGREREKIKQFLKLFISGSEFALIDLTHIVSLSENVISAVLGYNTKREFSPQIHMIFLFSLDTHMPSYFRIVPGSIRDVSSFVLTVKEAGVKNVVIIGDKGFYSEDNVNDLGTERLHYILPLKRNSSLIDYSQIKRGDKSGFEGYFLFEKRVIWYYSYKIEKGNLKDNRVFVFLDIRLKAEEEKDYISRIENDETKTIEKFHEIQHRQGTIAVITDLNKTGERIYNLLKSRVEIEQMIDAFKNVLKADRTYMRDDCQMEGWMFINFIALLFYYKLYGLLSSKDLLKKYSPKDVLLELSNIKKLKIGEEWFTSEVPKKARTILEKLDIAIP